MERKIILSVNDNPDYLYYAPLCVWAWKYWNWNPILLYYGNITDYESFVLEQCADFGGQIMEIPKIDGFRSDTITQVSRLHGYLFSDAYMMFGDIDMLPLSDYWNPDYDCMTCYGWDLTGKGHIPICYIGAPGPLMREIFSNNKNYIASEIEYDLNMYGRAQSDIFDDYWYSDQEIATKKINQYGINRINFIDRGKYQNGFAIGRVDRGSWKEDLDQYIDCHVMRNAHRDVSAFEKNLSLLLKIFGAENISWMKQYTPNHNEIYKRTYG